MEAKSKQLITNNLHQEFKNICLNESCCLFIQIYIYIYGSRKRAHVEKSALGTSARGINRSRKKAQIQLFYQIILLITVEFVSHINVNMKMCVI